MSSWKRGKGKMLTGRATFPKFLLISCSLPEEKFAMEEKE
jgi:hypothetical protein